MADEAATAKDGQVCTDQSFAGRVYYAQHKRKAGALPGDSQDGPKQTVLSECVFQGQGCLSP